MRLRERRRASGRVADRPRQKLCHAGVAPVVHMQLIGRDERLERHMLHIVPVAHDRETVEQIDAVRLRGAADRIGRK